MENKGSTRRKGQRRGHRGHKGHGKHHGNREGQGHPYVHDQRPPGQPQNSHEHVIPLLSLSVSGPHGSHFGARDGAPTGPAGSGPPDGLNEPQGPCSQGVPGSGPAPSATAPSPTTPLPLAPPPPPRTWLPSAQNTGQLQ